MTTVRPNAQGVERIELEVVIRLRHDGEGIDIGVAKNSSEKPIPISGSISRT